MRRHAKKTEALIFVSADFPTKLDSLLCVRVFEVKPQGIVLMLGVSTIMNEVVRQCGHTCKNFGYTCRAVAGKLEETKNVCG